MADAVVGNLKKAQVAECELGNKNEIKNDFEKLLLARAGVRVMIFDGGTETVNVKIAELLAEKVKAFNGSRPEDAWLLAAWEQNGDAWAVKYFRR